MTTKNDGFDAAEGNTPLDEDEIVGLIPAHVQTRAELNSWEATNIGHAIEWAYGRAHVDVLSVETLQELHRRMFGATWTWAGTFRRADKNISPHHWPQVPVLVVDLVMDVRAQYEANEKSPPLLDDIAMRFHHRLVRIHPWPNGNGRHARLATDLLLREWNRPRFSWGDAASDGSGEDVRRRYISALRAADSGDFAALRSFVRG